GDWEKLAPEVSYQPRLVLTDVSTLSTLPPRELTSGWAEVIKHGAILDAELFALFEEKADALKALEPQLTADVIGRNVAIKARVASEDEKETTGLRTLLNYGHTIGHALEAATNYEGYLHGEAVAVGMVGAAIISQRMGLLTPDAVERLRKLLQRFGLPVASPGVSRDAVLRAMSLDKKVEGKAIKWVMLEGIGRAVVRRDVPEADVMAALQTLGVR
ncbi:MAG: 3-dehydroquinate synthase family protein, partial [Chloroflexota bacterium]